MTVVVSPAAWSMVVTGAVRGVARAAAVGTLALGPGWRL